MLFQCTDEMIIRWSSSRAICDYDSLEHPSSLRMWRVDSAILNPLQCDFIPPHPSPFGQQLNPFAQQALFYGQQPQFAQATTASDSRRGGSHATTSILTAAPTKECEVTLYDTNSSVKNSEIKNNKSTYSLSTCRRHL
ncbi:hypothetical protein KIN20_018385 [Parelaphostrongylus tenuis]|uniref:Uncharacterized protein n=1 Tax=Parelaphostrongylus tenuis TaxID=148309 RepID=A0AAD5MJD9_PARTN|nr:hypothetical protein KIN20_018385 [Parelaphostrongylus tenuis]